MLLLYILDWIQMSLPSITNAAICCYINLNFISKLPRERFIPFCINSLTAPVAHVRHSMLAEIKVLLEAQLG